jgi:hypothetical protein
MKFRPWHGVALVIWLAACGAIFFQNYRVTEGRKTFERLTCPSCHLAGGAPSLERVGNKYDRATLKEFITNPDAVYARMGRRPLNAGYTTMPKPKATPHEIEMLSYFLAAQQ